MRVEIEEEFFVAEHFGAPSRAIKGLQFFEFFLREFSPVQSIYL